MTGSVLNIQRFCIHDGPGIRTTVFLKGCNLKCLWCHNPESQHSFPELMYYRHKCIGCGKCTEICRNTFTKNCTACGKCVAVCEKAAREISGSEMTVDEVFNAIKRDKEFYRTSGGGITFSGGEPLLQYKFVAEVLKKCKDEGISTAIETAANVDWKVFEAVLPYLDFIMCDVKCSSEKKHIELTGVSNKQILKNVEKLKQSGKKILFRMPVVPQFNYDEVGNVAKLVQGFDFELMAFHKTGFGKYDALDLKNPTLEIEPPTQDEMYALAKEYGAIYSPSGV